MTMTTTPRPKFNERDGRLLLAAVHHWRKTERYDEEIERLYGRLQRLYGDKPRAQAGPAQTNWSVGR